MASEHTPQRIAHSLAEIEKMAANARGYDYDDEAEFQASAWDLINGATDWLDNGEYLSHGSVYEGFSVPREFWHHYRIVTGRKVNFKDMETDFFSCSC